MTIKAICFRVLLKPDDVEETTKAGIHIVMDKKLERNDQSLGTVLDIGEDAFAAFRPTREYAGLEIGDRVFYAKRAGKWCKDPKSGEELLMVNDEDIVGKYIQD